MVGYDKAGFVDDVDSNFESSSRCSSPRDTSLRFPNFSTEVREAPSPSKILGVVVVFNITKRRVRHSYPMGSGVSFLIWDSVGDSLYTGAISLFHDKFVDICNGNTIPCFLLLNSVFCSLPQMTSRLSFLQ